MHEIQVHLTNTNLCPRSDCIKKSNKKICNYLTTSLLVILDTKTKSGCKQRLRLASNFQSNTIPIDSLIHFISENGKLI